VVEVHGPVTLVPVFIPHPICSTCQRKHFITASAMVRLYGIHDSTCKVSGLPVLFDSRKQATVSVKALSLDWVS